MMPDWVEARYLLVKWSDPETVAQAKVADRRPLAVLASGHRLACVSARVFPGFDHWIALHFSKLPVGRIPRVVYPDGRREDLLRVVDVSGKEWWIDRGVPHPEGMRRVSETQRSAGNLRIEAHHGAVVVRIAMDTASHRTVQRCLDDFQEEFASLALSEASAVGGSVARRVGATSDLPEAMRRFAEDAGRLLSHLGRDIVEREVLRPPSRTRPSGATYRAYAANPAASNLPGRGFIETYDTPVNRQLRSMVLHCMKLARSLCSALDGGSTRMVASAAAEREEAGRLEGVEVNDSASIPADQSKMRKPTAEQLADRRADARIARNHARRLEERSRERANLLARLETAHRALAGIEAKLRHRGIGETSSPALSGPWATSSRHVACLRAYQAIRRLSQSSDAVVMSRVDAGTFGVLHASALYERWCLLKVISVLRDTLGFEPVWDWHEWAEALLSAWAAPQATWDAQERAWGDGLSLLMRRGESGMFASVEVQPKLRNGKRPDCRVRFAWEEADLSKAKGLVIDAKFRPRWSGYDLEAMLRTLVVEKAYGSEGDRVFVVHPAPFARRDPVSPLAWGKHCDYGEDKGGHAMGCIMLAPVSRGAMAGKRARNPELNLQRLFCIPIQELFRSRVAGDGESARGLFCVECGGEAYYEKRLVNYSDEYGRDRQWTKRMVSCRAECGLQTMLNHCWDCDTYLYKNGGRLTYHLTRAGDAADVACPDCGEHLQLRSRPFGRPSHRNPDRLKPRGLSLGATRIPSVA